MSRSSLTEDEFADLAENAMKRLGTMKFIDVLERIMDHRIADPSPELILQCRTRCLMEMRAFTLLREVGVSTTEQEVVDHGVYEKFLEVTHEKPV